MFDRRLPLRSKEPGEDPLTARYRFDSDEERFEDDHRDHQTDFMTERSFLFSRARENDVAQAQAVRRALQETATQLVSRSEV
jgi:hypothetical protein